MPINIQSLFSDIIETPAQRQQRLLGEGVMRGREITRGVTNPLVPTALASTIAARQPLAQDRLKRSVGGMLGLDVRNESEMVQDALSQVDPNDPQSLLSAANMIGEMGMGAQAAQMRQMAAEQQREAEDRERRMTTQDLQQQRLQQQIDAADILQERSVQEQTQYESLMDNLATRVEEIDPEAAAMFRSYNIPPGTALNFFQSLTAAPDVDYRYETISGESVSNKVEGVDVDPERNYRVQINADTGEIINAWLDKSPEDPPERDIPPTMSDQAISDIEEIMGDRFDKFMEDLSIPGTGGFLGTGKDKVPAYSPDGDDSYTEAAIRNDIYSLSQKENISLQQAANKVFEDIEQQRKYIKITQDMIDADDAEGADLRRAGAEAGQIFDIENKRFL